MLNILLTEIKIKKKKNYIYTVETTYLMNSKLIFSKKYDDYNILLSFSAHMYILVGALAIDHHFTIK